MKNLQNYMYHPFAKPSFGMMIISHGFNFSNDESYGFTIDDIDLYYQPLEHPAIAISVSAFKSIILTIGVLLCMKVITKINKEPSIDAQMVKIFCWAQIVFQIGSEFIYLLINLFHPINEIIGNWFCDLVWIYFSFGTKLIFNHSFFVALMRFIFIKHNQMVTSYGKNKFKRHFMYFSILVSVFGMLVDVIEIRGLSRTSFINKCYGNDDKIFLIETSALYRLQRKLWKVDTYKFEEYGEALERVFAIVLKVVRLIKNLIFLLTGFNIMEGIIYFNIFSYIKRQEKEILRKIRKMLNDSSVQRRHQRIMLNIHISFLAWLTEFFGFFLLFLGIYVVGHENNIVTYSMQILTLIVYFNLLPSVLLLNSSEFKDPASESPVYERFLGLFNWQYKEDLDKEENNDEGGEGEDYKQEANRYDDQQHAIPNNQHVNPLVDLENDNTE